MASKNDETLTIVVALKNDTYMATTTESKKRATCTYSKVVAARRLAAKVLDIDEDEAELRLTKGTEFNFFDSGNSHFVFRRKA